MFRIHRATSCQGLQTFLIAVEKMSSPNTSGDDIIQLFLNVVRWYQQDRVHKERECSLISPCTPLTGVTEIRIKKERYDSAVQIV